MTDTYVQFGFGLSAPEGWINFDASPRLRLERIPGISNVMGQKALFPKNIRYGDIIKGLPLEDNSVKGLYCSHVLEHIYREEVELALHNCFSILKPGGIFRLVVPDIQWRIEEYIRLQGSAEETELLQKRLHLRSRTPARGVEAKLRDIFGLSMHQWMYDEALMSKILSDAGFSSIRRCQFNDCEDPVFAQVEDTSRFVDTGFDELAMECRKA